MNTENLLEKYLKPCRCNKMPIFIPQYGAYQCVNPYCGYWDNYKSEALVIWNTNLQERANIIESTCELEKMVDEEIEKHIIPKEQKS